HRGDGWKQAGQAWTRRSYHLATKDKKVADWLQSMCLRRGWRANVAPSANVWVVHCSQGEARYIGGSTATDRPTLQMNPSNPGERVWCVSVASGALFVRRNGKACVAGNCQMVGRGTRIHEGKTDLLL